MVDWKRPMARVSRRTRITTSAIALLALGAAGGAGAVSLTRSVIEMAPTVPTAIARLPHTSGIVTVKGRVAEVYGNRFVVQDASGRTLVDTGRDGAGAFGPGSGLTVQGRYDNGQLRASYLIDPQGQVEAVGGPTPHGGPDRLGRHGGPDGHDGPGGPRGDGPPPPPPGGAVAVPPPPPGGTGAAPTPPPPAGAPGSAPPPPSGAQGSPPPAPIDGRAPVAPPAPLPRR